MAQAHKIDPDHFSSRISLGCPKKRNITFKFRSFFEFREKLENLHTAPEVEKSLKRRLSKGSYNQNSREGAKENTLFFFFFNLIRETKS